ncbi:MULTI-COPPER OXIDASE TYPE I FAMILY PROTEIN [Salix koriyanagi]|uniref:MULTI-COPPER OXIDASE TYPE I FAMILY PROTEIN n=1 Tax=Salix koriyanagi TaxID=2511006 RepID=A0A9Q0SAV9_9ROSI|nr:MULTI-COPPER OXIDASE TYPE I FAMILY PROTEIN [Salix koriyanagi]
MRRNSWQDGVQETNCPILPGQNWTYSFQVKDQIGSFFYFPSLLLHKAAGGYGPIRVNNREVIPLPFPQPHGDIDVLIGDWYSADHRDLRALLDNGIGLQNPIGILINGRGPNETVFKFEPGATYRLRISNVGLKTSLNFRIQDHLMLLVETEGSYTAQQTYRSLDIHASFATPTLMIFHPAHFPQDHSYMIISTPIEQARSIRWNLSAGAARPNPQGSYHYGRINASRTIVLRNGEIDTNRHLYTVNGVSLVHQGTPLKMADYFELESSRTGNFPDTPTDNGISTLGASVINANYREFYHLVFENPTPYLQTWHLDGYNFFVVGMESGTSSWEEDMKATYNLNDAVSRSTVQVYPSGWTAVMVMLDNQGLWNLRSQDAERWYLGQELYLRVRGIGEEDPSTIPVRDEVPIPENAILCGGISGL